MSTETSMVIQVQIKNVYGEERIYPVSPEAKVFAEMLGQTTLTRQNVAKIKQLGYTVAVVTDAPKTL